MNPKRRTLLAALLATCTAAPANAGCLDWLFGRSSAPATPYVTGYAPQPTITALGPPTLTGTTVAPYAAGYAAGYSPYASGYKPYTAGDSPYTAGYAGFQPNVAAQAPVYAAAVPAYGVAVPTVAPVTAYSLPLDNPSVLTGRPVLQSSYYGNAALPPAAFAPAPQPPTSWFGRMFGNSYQTSYYGVPTTSYRPVTQVDPTTGGLVTLQQPCTSLTQQVQRTPYTSLQPAAQPTVPYYGEPTCGSEGFRYAPPTTYAPQVGAYSAPTGVSQATALGPNNGAPGYASPIPATGNLNYNIPQPGYGGLPAPLTAPNTQPLTGFPGGASGDHAPLAAPQLDSFRPAWSLQSPSSLPSAATSAVPSLPPAAFPSANLPSTSYPATSNGLVAPPLPETSGWPDRREVRAAESSSESFANRSQTSISDIAPIPAADDYRAPTWGELYTKPNATPVDSGRDRWNTPARASSAEPRTASNDRPAGEGTLRYASSPAALPPLPPAAPQVEPPRDDSGWFVIEPK